MVGLALHKKQPLQIVLDEPVIYLKDYNGPTLVRGEVIVSFAHDTQINGLIELSFEGILRLYAWHDPLDHRPLGSTKESKLYVSHLSLIPPHQHNATPAGVHRFPFEFPIPSSLPTNVSIPKRIDVFYRLSTTLHCSHSSTSALVSNMIPTSLSKRRFTANAQLRLVRAVECVPGMSHAESSISNEDVQTTTQLAPAVVTAPSAAEDEWWRSVSIPRFTLDEQYDRLLYSLSGRISTNMNRLPSESERGVHYQIGVDRTAIALGTSVGIDIKVIPTLVDITIRSITLTISETRQYVRHSLSNCSQIDGKRISKETAAVVLKWAYGFPNDNDHNKSSSATKTNGRNGDALTKQYLHQKAVTADTTHYGVFSSSHREKSRDSAQVTVGSPEDSACSVEEEHTQQCDEMINLKLLNQPVTLNQYFDGRFTLPVPACNNILHPSMDYDQIKINHWMKLNIGVQHGSKLFEISMKTPIRVLDCRLVSSDDNRQTILPPPPSYLQTKAIPSPRTSGVSFWEQRQPITMTAGWGACHECPCIIKLAAKKKKSEKTPCPSVKPEWGPPPCYTE